ncbi:hypothetical protein KR044_007177 [Drosophila immigrans]|nr:hypothetical protein KR044_007177 [Drosophila immigrans]
MSKFDILKPLECDNYNTSYIRNLSVCLRNTQLNANFDLLTPLVLGLRVNLEFYNKKENMKPYYNFYKYSFDVCTLMSKLRNNLFKRWFSTFLSYGNFKRDCPVPPNHYYLKNYNVNDLNVPTFLFPGFYRLSFSIVQNKNEGRGNDFIISCSVEIKLK